MGSAADVVGGGVGDVVGGGVVGVGALEDGAAALLDCAGVGVAGAVERGGATVVAAVTGAVADGAGWVDSGVGAPGLSGATWPGPIGRSVEAGFAVDSRSLGGAACRGGWLCEGGVLGDRLPVAAMVTSAAIAAATRTPAHDQRDS